jgi:hypothetical protein
MDITNLEQQSPRTEKRFNQNPINTRCGTINYIKPDKQPELELIINLQNLYINPKTYRTDYNFYNYNRFKQTQAIPIIYKTPSIFLNGLHFELPPVNIISISKPIDTQNIRLLVRISKQDFKSSVSFDDILAVFQKIEDYNTDFFDKHASKMDIKISRTLKNTMSSDTHSTTTTKDLGINRFKTAGWRRLDYRPFFEQNGDNISLQLEIKRPYLAKIIQSQYLTLTSQHITNQAEITEPIREYIREIETLNEILNLEFFELKKKKIETTLAQRPISIRIWIKCNMFGLDTQQNRIAMRWKVCNYEC